MYVSVMPEISAQNDMYKINSKHCSARKQSLGTGLTADLGPPIDRLAVNHPPPFCDNRCYNPSIPHWLSLILTMCI